MTASRDGRAMRADAQRNRAGILDAADAVLQETGDARMTEVARRAGVAVGTLYRHYPTKEALVGAVVERRVEALAARAIEAARAVAGGASPRDELVALLGDLAASAAQDRVAKGLARALGVSGSSSEAESGAADAVAQLLATGIEAGEVRADITVADLYLLVEAIPVDVDEARRARWVELVARGLVVEP